MVIYADAIGNYFLGDCIYANHRVDYPTVNHLQAFPIGGISAELTALCTTAGLKFRNVLGQSFFDSLLTSTNLRNVLLFFGASDDSIDDRYTFKANWGGGVTAAGTSSDGAVELFNNSGSTNTTNNLGLNTNRLFASEIPTSSGYGLTGGITPLNWGINFFLNSNLWFAGVSDGKSLGLFTYQYDFVNNTYRTNFHYAGLLDSVNTGFNYYSQNNITKSIALSGGRIDLSGNDILNGRHYIASASKYILSTGDAQYPIVCADGQSPTPTWATDFYVFDNNATLGYPAMGKVRNMLLAQGTFTIGKPVRIDPTVYPDAGFNCWLPVGTFAGKTALMRCYSSLAI